MAPLHSARHYIRTALAAGLLTSILTPLPAFALDGQALLDKINAGQNASKSGKIEAAGIEVNGDDVVFKDVTLSFQAGPESRLISLKPGDIRMTDVVEQANGGYTIGEISVPPLTFSEDVTELSLGTTTVSQATIPANPGAPGLDGVTYYEKASFGPMTVKQNGNQVLSIGALEGSVTPAEDGEGATTTVQATDLTLTPKPEDAPWLADFGLTVLRGDMTMSGTWLAREGTTTIDELTISAEKLGSLSLTLGLSGITQDFIAEVQKASQTANAGGDAAQASQFALFGLLQQVNLSDISLYFEDDGLTGRSLEYAGRKQGVSAQQMGEMTKAMVPLVLAQYGIKDEGGRIAGALQTFLAEPQNLSIEYAPEKPVPFMQIIASPLELLSGPDTTIAANEDPE